MTPDEINLIRQILKEIQRCEEKHIIFNLHNKFSLQDIDRAIAVLPCETCFNEKQIVTPREDTPGVDWGPCPDCT